MDKSASADQCLAGLSAVLRAPCCSVPKAAAQYILERFDDDDAVCLRLYLALLGTSEEHKVAEPFAVHLHCSAWYLSFLGYWSRRTVIALAAMHGM